MLLPNVHFFFWGGGLLVPDFLKLRDIFCRACSCRQPVRLPLPNKGQKGGRSNDLSHQTHCQRLWWSSEEGNKFSSLPYTVSSFPLPPSLPILPYHSHFIDFFRGKTMKQLPLSLCPWRRRRRRQVAQVAAGTEVPKKWVGEKKPLAATGVLSLSRSPVLVKFIVMHLLYMYASKNNVDTSSSSSCSSVNLSYSSFLNKKNRFFFLPFLYEAHTILFLFSSFLLVHCTQHNCLLSHLSLSLPPLFQLCWIFCVLVSTYFRDLLFLSFLSHHPPPINSVSGFYASLLFSFSLSGYK